MRAEDILKKALDELKSMSSEEVKARSIKNNIVVPEEPKMTDWLNHFVFDLRGFFREIVNSEENLQWFDNDFNHRQVIAVKNKKKSHQKVALSFLCISLDHQIYYNECNKI